MQNARHLRRGALQRAVAPSDGDGGAASGDGGDDSGGSCWSPTPPSTMDGTRVGVSYVLILPGARRADVGGGWNAVPNLPMGLAKEFATSEPTP